MSGEPEHRTPRHTQADSGRDHGQPSVPGGEQPEQDADQQTER